jgi:hypothetical protein
MLRLANIYLSRDSSVSLVIGYGVDGRGSIADTGKTFFFTPHRPDRLGHIQPPIQWVLGLLQRGYSGRGVRLTTHLYLFPMLRMRGVIRPLRICLCGVVLN